MRVDPPDAEARIPKGHEVAPLGVKDHVPYAVHVRVAKRDHALIRAAHVEEPQRAVAVAEQHSVRVQPPVRVEPLRTRLPHTRQTNES